MTAELAKLRYLDFPRWAAAGILGAAVLVGALLIALQPTRLTWYEDVPPLAVGSTYLMVAIVFGVWGATLEFSSGTLQRTLTAEPDRHRVLAAKLVVVIGWTLVVGLATTAAVLGLTDVAASRAGVDYDAGSLARMLAALPPGALAGALVGFGLGLLTRSMGGGITGALALVFVLDGALSTIPGLGDWSFGRVTGDLQNGISGQGDTVHGIAAAAVATLLWCLIVLLPGWFTFTRGDLR